MTTQEIATSLVNLLRSGSFEEAQKTFLAEDAISIEPNASFFSQQTEGLANILEKGAKFRASIEKVNGLKVSDPIVAGNTFALSFTLDADFIENGRIVFSEICVFSIAESKIIKEVYFY